MGLTHRSTGSRAAETSAVIERQNPDERIVALAGNPNVGKSTVFNALTGMHQHTGNWPGKTVTNAQGRFHTRRRRYALVDLPGTYSLMAHSEEERVARDFLCSGAADAVVVVCDATCLQRSLHLVLQTLELTPNVIVCVNLMDEAARKGISIDLAVLSARLGVPVVGCAAREKGSLSALTDALDALEPKPLPDARPEPTAEETAVVAWAHRAEAICADAVRQTQAGYGARDRRIDRVLTGRVTGYGVMLLLLAGLLWLTISGANVLSDALSAALFWVQEWLSALLVSAGAPAWLQGALIDGVYRVLSWVVSVMLPPMAIFFPLFTLLEDAGYLPRVAYALDKPFQRCDACGKQALTMCMGFGCNAAGVVGCRIIDSERERLLAMLTNCFVPCNGRFPVLIALLTMFFTGSAVGAAASLRAALLLTGLIVLGIAVTFGVTKLLSRTVLRGVPSSFTLELPPYRRPQWGQVLVRSVLDRTLFVLGRAAAVAAPAGLILWALANATIGGESLLSYCAAFLDPFARLMGLDGVILLAFILGLPANEIVLPILLMAYLSQGTLPELGTLDSLREILLANGWTWVTAGSAALFTLLHWPCSTTVITIRRETGSRKWTALAVLLPTVTGVLACMLFNAVSHLFL